MNEQVSTELDDENILSLVQSQSRRFDRQIRRRDMRELIASAVAALAIAPAAIHGSWLARAGALVIIGGLVLIAVRLIRARRGGSVADATLPVAGALRAERTQLDAQIALLGSVLWWYVAPLAIGSVMMVAGQSGASPFTLGYTVVVSFGSWGIVALNAAAVRRLRPKRDELTRLLAQLES